MTYPDKIYIGQLADGTLGLCSDEYALEYVKAAPVDAQGGGAYVNRYGQGLIGGFSTAKPNTAQLDGLMGIIESQKQTYDVLIKMVRERDAAVIKLIDNIICECESQMSNAEHRKKVAGMDYHTSEIQHQEGRWHCANDLRKWAETHKATIEAAGLGYEN